MKSFSPDVRLWLGLGLSGVVAVAGVSLYLNSANHNQHDPNHALQQLDLFYLNQPAPYAHELNVNADQPTIVLFCDGCQEPILDGPVTITRSYDRKIAKAYRMVDADGKIAEGYVLIDTRGNVRYRTYDPKPQAHTSEINKLIKNLP